MDKPLSTAERPPGCNGCRAKFLAASLAFISLPACAAAPFISELAGMSIEDLAKIEITSVSKKAERLADAAASVYVITADDIHRSGATSLPEALRLAPNLQVAQASASGYAITARGFNGSNSSAPNKLLVLIDGRSVYTPLFSGVFWDMQDVMLEDVERIEVISGPAGTLWGSNAVNGVINIITRSAKDTQGGLAAAGGGNRGADTAFRYGGALGADGNYRVYGKYSERNQTSKDDSSAVDDAWHRSQAGFRADWNHPVDQVMVQGNVYSGGEQQPQPGALQITGLTLPLGPVSISGANITTRWAHALDGGSSINFQAYYDRTQREIVPTFDESLDVVDLQLQHTLRPIGAHSLVWGANYRYSMDRVTNPGPYFAFLPGDVNQKWGSLFAQDDIALRKNLRLTLGGRIEHNDYTGNEFLPTARLAWKVAPQHLLWAAASRTVRAPSRLDADSYISRSAIYPGPAVPGATPYVLNGGPDVRSEIAKVYEIGYRGQPTSRLSYSVTAFHTDYDDLRTQELNLGGATQVDLSRAYFVFANGMTGKTDGIETWGTYQVARSWRLSAGLTALRERLALKPGSNDAAAPNAAGNDPAYSWQLRSAFNIAQNRQLDLTVRHVAELSNGAVPAYTTMDARFGWKLRRDLELSVTGQNLFGHHAEYGPIQYRSDLAPAVYVKLLWQN